MVYNFQIRKWYRPIWHTACGIQYLNNLLFHYKVS